MFEHRAFASVRCALGLVATSEELPDVRAIDEALAGRAGVRFVPSPRKPLGSRDYNARVSGLREVPTRAGHWHDFANALVWATFPRAKRALHVRQSLRLEERHASGAANRTPEEDALAILDEGGLLAVYDEAAGRERVLVFGHAVLESVALGRPLVLGRGARVAVRSLALDEGALLAEVDASLARALEHTWPAHKGELATIETL